MKPIVVVGSLNMDLVANCDRVPVAGETISGSQFATYPGGKGGNQAAAVGRLGYPVNMIGKVGSDSFGEQLLLSLRDAGVNTDAVDTVPGSSGVAVILVSSRGQNCIVVTPGANALITPEDIDRHRGMIRSAGAVLAQLEIPRNTVEYLAEVCHLDGIPLILDPAPACALSASLLQRVTWFTPNETEASFYAPRRRRKDKSQLEGTMEVLLADGPAGVVMKLGEAGVYLADKSGLRETIPRVPVEAVDTTAAGDAFNGAFAVALMLGKNPADSARFAVAAAGLSVTRHGAQPSLPTFAEVEALLDKLTKTAASG